MENNETLKKKELSTFRIFKLVNGFEVWVGKNSDANDLLTLKYSKQNDLWFHIKSTSGSHTILKIPENLSSIPKDYVSKAASIAAYYSKSKNAARVSVIYTQVKNVRKYKGAKSGSVMIKNEKVIKVEPKLPEQTQNTDG
jgi:predicted ribosome quality control (RQC) complex YloA/Tae2 family protein